MGVVNAAIVLKPVDWKSRGARVDGEGDRALGLSRLGMDKVRRSQQKRQKAWPLSQGNGRGPGGERSPEAGAGSVPRG